MLVIPTTLLISDQIFGQNKQSNPDSQNSSLFGYPDGPARDPNVFSIGGTGGNNIIYAPGGSIAVNENPTYNNYTAAQLVQNILVTGCLKASNVTFTGVFNSSDPTKRQLGYFNKATSSFPMSEGLIMSSGYVSEAEGPNNSPSAGADLKGAGDADLTLISGYATHDAAILQFDFVPAGDKVEFQYIFASEEYLEWCCTQYNDVFGFFLSGPGITGPYSNNSINLATLPNSNPPVPVTINTIHQYVASNHNGVACPAQNPSYYVDNPSGSMLMQYDGYTVTLTAIYNVTPCQTYHIKLKVADVSDGIYSSAVFLKGRSFTSEPVSISNNNPVYGQGDFDNIFEGCSPDHLILSRPISDTTDPYTVSLQYSGTAVNGVDVKTLAGNPLPSQVTIPAGDTSYTIDYYAVADTLPDNGKVLNIGTLEGCPCDTSSVFVFHSIYIWKTALSASAVGNNILCNGVANGTINVTASGGSGNYQFSLNGTSWQISNLFTGLAQGTYTVYVRDIGSCHSPLIHPNVVVGPPIPIHANAGNDVTICSGTSTQLSGSGGINYSWSPATGLSATNIPNPVASPTATTNYILTVTDGNNLCTSKDSVVVSVIPSPVGSITPAAAEICAGSSLTLTASGGGTYLWNPGGYTTASITVSPVTNSSYTVIVTASNGCTDVKSANVFVYPAPQAFTVTGGGMICPGGSLAVGLSGSVTGNTYQLKLGVTNVGSPIAGTGSALSFGLQSTPGTYTVVASEPSHGCSAQMNGNAIIFMDNVPPSITCPGNIASNVSLGNCYASILTPDPVSSDNCAVTTLTWTLTGATTDNSPLTGINVLGTHQFNTGTTLVVYTVKDATGNTNSCSFNVVVTDNINPSITCPSTINQTADLGKCYATITALGTPVTSDNCGVQSVTNNAPANHQYGVGTNTVTWTVTDIHGNSSTCNQTITVTDDEAPAITCPSTINQTADLGKCYATITTLGTPVTSDNCGVASQ